MSYQRHDWLVAPARNDRAGWGWLGLGIVVVVVLTYAGSLVYYSLAQDALSVGPAALIGGATPLSMLTLLFSFGFWILALATAVPLVHKRDFRPMFGPTLASDFGKVFAGMILLYLALMVLPPWDQFDQTVPALAFDRWLVVLPLSLLGLLLQVTAEELLFRGYLQQQLAARFRSPLVWMVLPSALFGLAHYDPSFGSNTWLFVIWAFIFGLLTADLTARAGSLGPAIALHLVNNAFALLLVAPPDSLSGLALFHYSFALTDETAVRALLPIDFALMFVSWLVARLAIRA